MKIVKGFAGAAVVTLLAGCATAGNEKLKDHTQSTISQRITEGRTTKNQVIAALGQPSVVSFTDAGNEIWTYKHARATPQAQNFIPLVGLFSSGADVKTKELVVMFNKDEVVSKYTMRETDEVVKSGLIH
ncbi:outer membrane protein assembly factor BamE domain-containing protein [Nitrosospira briensis]|uniref:outer membrane protein assembly factor BamE domain-containing protein n=1 Tax=Nitrosospira briensis TaxID=35799 RepID=UPI0008EC762A|nr:outer membrane protein assembly factor BamE [Nitrosospira briensis]SFO03885.1 Beta-barrel assembly machine subunit BamE [Nitrosospira briensis]